MSHPQPIAGDSQAVLRTALRANGGFSAGSGSTMILASGTLGELLGVEPSGILVFIGANLLVFAAALLYVAGRQPVPRPLAWTAVVLDVLWVGGSILLLLTDLAPLTAAGRWTVALLAFVVAGFAGAQWIGLRRS
jgi:hypothetical protein